MGCLRVAITQPFSRGTCWLVLPSSHEWRLGCTAAITFCVELCADKRITVNSHHSPTTPKCRIPAKHRCGRTKRASGPAISVHPCNATSLPLCHPRLGRTTPSALSHLDFRRSMAPSVLATRGVFLPRLRRPSRLPWTTSRL